MKYIFVTGEMRSGTTFIANLLNSQKNILLYSDSLLDLFKIGKKLGITDINKCLSTTEVNLLVSYLNAEGFSSLGVDFNSLRQYNTWLKIFSNAIELLVNGQEQIKLAGIKKTNERDFLEPLLKEGVKVINVVRDPRDVMLSNKNRHVEHQIFFFAERLKKNLNLCRELDEKYENHTIVFYNNLILNKESEKKRLSDFLDIELNFELDILKYRDNLKYSNNSSFGDVSKLFDKNAVGRWKSELKNEEVVFANWFFQNEISWMNLDIAINIDLSIQSKLIKSYRYYSRMNQIVNFLKKFKPKIN